ncbi:hypothetical protein BASA81_010122 [Batrachochytrium salamandrivorans]|nr:hypothetical protein BASA81_010122 [Batrachochytrium salamandrivorans]
MSKGYVYITGCDTGFGRLAVDLFLEQGYGVFAGVFSPASVGALQRECKSPELLSPVQLNVTSEESVRSAAAEIKAVLASKGSRLIGLVNNAGILVQPCPTEWQRMQDFRDMLDVNVIGMACVTQSVLPLLRASQGRVVIVSSLLGRLAAGTESAYCASKFAVQGYADALRKDMLPWGVTVHIVEPGVFPNTGLYAKFESGLDTVWRGLDPEIKRDYGEDHYKFCRALMLNVRSNFGTLDSSLVSKAYLHAVTSDKAMYRYRVGNDCKFLTTPMTYLHESTQDAILTANDPALPYVKPAAAPIDGPYIATSRMDKNWPKFWALTALAIYIFIKLRKA